MYACACVYMYVCMYVCMYVSIYLSIYVCVCVCVCVCYTFQLTLLTVDPCVVLSAHTFVFDFGLF